jgi:hypothetical protein
LDRFSDDVVDAVELVGRNDVRRKDVNDVAERAQQDVALEEKIVELGTQTGKIAGIVDAEFECAEAAKLASVAYLVKIAKLR